MPGFESGWFEGWYLSSSYDLLTDFAHGFWKSARHLLDEKHIQLDGF